MNLRIKNIKAIGRSILSRTQFGIHGINPKLTYEPSGKTFELPRFSSIEMRQARQMNKIAISEIKHPKVRTYKKATPKDLQQLTSTSIEDSFSRVEWTNPKDGKVYNILKQGETKDGKIIVRILDEDGAFIKEAELTPKTIMIPDNYEDATTVLDIPHGDLVTTYAKRFNPFARYIKVQLDRSDLANNLAPKIIMDSLEKNRQVDFISCSFGHTSYTQSKLKMSKDIMKLAFPATDYDLIAKPNRRILFSAYNANPSEYPKINELSNNILCVTSKVEGVGSLSDKTGRISEFSMSRNSELTQHYEIGEFTPTITKDGLNITGLSGTDMPFPKKYLERISKNPFLGKPVDRVQKIVQEINNQISRLTKEKYKLFGTNKTVAEIQEARNELEKRISTLTQRKIKINTFLNELTNVNGQYNVSLEKITGTSFSTPIRTAKLALNDMMEGII